MLLTGDLFVSLLGGNKVIISYALYAMILVGIYGNKKLDVKSFLRSNRWKVWLTVICILHIVSLSLFWAFHWGIYGISTLITVGLNLLVDSVVVIWLCKMPDKNRRIIDAIYNENTDFISKYNDLLTIPVEHLTPKDRKRYNLVMSTVLMELGDLQKAYNLMLETEPTDSVLTIMMESLMEEAKGHMTLAEQKMKSALDLPGVEREDGMYIQLLNNYGRNCLICGDLEQASWYYGKAKEQITDKTDKQLIYFVYSNYIMCAALKGHSMDTLQALLDEYKETLKGDGIENAIEYNNLELIVARQLNDRQRCEEVIKRSLGLLDGRMNEEAVLRKLNYEISCFRMMHTMQVDSRPCLEVIRADLSLIKNAPMPERYYFAKELHIGVRENSVLPDCVIEEFKDVFDYATEYITHSAKRDLEEYCAALPECAVYAYGKTQQELVGIARYLPDYSYAACKERIMNVCNMYEKREMNVEALKTALMGADENFQSLNVGKDFEVKNKQEVRSILEYAEGLAKDLMCHPAFAEDYLRFAFCYMHLYEYEKGTYYYEKFTDCKLSKEHYAPWMQGNIEFVRLMVFVEQMQQKLISLKTDRGKLQHLSVKAKRWIAMYPNNSSQDITLLWGALLVGCNCPIFEKKVTWIDEAGNLIGNHFWFVMLQILENGEMEEEFELDMAYEQVCDLDSEDVGKRLVFPDQHPLETRESLWMKDMQKNQHMVFSEIEKVGRTFPIYNEDGKKTYLEELRSLLAEEVKSVLNQ